MCNLESEPWRKDFTGPLCRCGVPTPGNAEEKSLEKKLRFERFQQTQDEWRKKFDEVRKRRIEEMFNRYPKRGS